MKIAGIAIAVLFAAIGLVLLAGHFWLQNYINTPEFRAMAESAVSDAVSAPVKLESVGASLWNTVEVKGITVACAPPLAQVPFATGKVLKVNISLSAILRKEIKIISIELEQPAVVLRQMRDGSVLLPQKRARSESRGDKAMAVTTAQSSAAPGESGFKVVLDETRISKGRFQFLDVGQNSLVLADGIGAKGTIKYFKGELDSTGQLEVVKVVAGKALAITAITTPFSFQKRILDMPSISGKIYGGQLQGNFKSNFGKPNEPYELSLKIEGMEVGGLMADFGNQPDRVQGVLRADAKMSGQMSQFAPSSSGQGTFSMRQVKIAGSPVLGSLGKILGVPGLADTKFDSVEGSFVLKNEKLVFEKIETFPKQNATHLVISGTYGLDGSLDLRGDITLNAGLMGGVSQLLKAVKVSEGNGVMTIPFTVRGTADSPKVSVEMTQAAEGAIKGLMNLIK